MGVESELLLFLKNRTICARHSKANKGPVRLRRDLTEDETCSWLIQASIRLGSAEARASWLAKQGSFGFAPRYEVRQGLPRTSELTSWHSPPRTGRGAHPAVSAIAKANAGFRPRRLGDTASAHKPY
ncbi:hypothetical protein ACJJTC_009050 [Scirpophaga incertulas]